MQAETEAALSDAPFDIPTSTVGAEDDESVRSAISSLKLVSSPLDSQVNDDTTTELSGGAGNCSPQSKMISPLRVDSGKLICFSEDRN